MIELGTIRVGMKYSVDKWYGGYGAGVIEIDEVSRNPFNPSPEYQQVRYSYWGRDNQMTGGEMSAAALLERLEWVGGKVHWTIGA